MDTTATTSLDTVRIASMRRALAVLLLLAVLLPAGCEALFARQSRKLDALITRGRVTVGEVTRSTSTTTAYRYEVDGNTLVAEVSRERAPLAAGATVSVRYLPDAPSFSRPTGEPREVMREFASQRRFATTVVIAVGLFFLGLAAMTFRELRRLLRGVDARSDEALRARRNEALAFCGALVLAVGLAHASDASARGESLLPVALGTMFGAAVLLGTVTFLTKGGATMLHVRLARLPRWLMPVAVTVAMLRIVAWFVSR